ncbi:MAG: asparagine synthase (glutamine-hydrolyzing), partial [Hymenobacteraceae bacterium]|nr:asparagine synthase (glutamine-hydrolyzing) [Hymenobacteraceae bacterium]MDX5394763.1 asparagine synthase (glutamine-hydrolyzing) [Hymenobacteraceae bacterium]MDX5510794.1 asparagine synthase (glutamine-hydrolyzing) [Hymenobacteraceae bacterium]
SEAGKSTINKLEAATNAIESRGPDSSGTYVHGQAGLGHRRLSILDLTECGSQPMHDKSGRYTIVFNGEIFNYPELKKQLEAKGEEFKSTSDTEVLLRLYMLEGRTFLNKLNGFFAFAIHDIAEDTLFIARDRFGQKPLLVYQDEDKLVFASEMKALLAFGIPRKLDFTSVYQFLQLNYIPGPASIFENVQKLTPGTSLFIKAGKVTHETWYKIPYNPEEVKNQKLTYEQQQEKLVELLDKSVQRRMLSDVPLGAFLSGGIDSSVIVALASRYTDKLNTFSIGYKDEPFFDETKYAKLVADKYKTNHTVFSLTNQDLFDHLFDVLDYIDEPFADSSALA